MASLEADALVALSNSVRSLLPVATPPDPEPDVAVAPSRMLPIGIGGLAGMSAAPAGPILGTRVDAVVELTARVTQPEQLAAKVAVLTGALMGAERAALAAQGIVRLTLAPPTAAATTAGDSTPLARTLRFQILYEFLRFSAEGEGVIARIPITVSGE